VKKVNETGSDLTETQNAFPAVIQAVLTEDLFIFPLE
jgi:hypothetical protein